MEALNPAHVRQADVLVPAHQLRLATPGVAARLNPAEADRLRGFIDGAEVPDVSP